MERRDFISMMVAGVVSTIVFDNMVQGATVVPSAPVLNRKPLSLSDIMHVAWPAVVTEMHRRKYGSEYVQLIDSGKIEILPLKDITYPLESTTIPMCWTQRDEDLQTTEASKIDFCKCMLENLCNSFDSYIVEEAKAHTKVILAKEDLFALSDTYRMSSDELGRYFVTSAHVTMARIR